jgi:LysR family transcriptional activator of nhaA
MKFKGLRKGFPKSLEGQPVIFPTFDSRMRHDLDQWIKDKSLELDIVTQSQDISLNKLFAINGIGIIPAASHSVQRQVLAGELMEIGRLDGIYEELFLISADRKIPNPVAAALFKNFSI